MPRWDLGTFFFQSCHSEQKLPVVRKREESAIPTLLDDAHRARADASVCMAVMDSRIYDDEGPPTPHQGHDGAFYQDPAGSGGNGSGGGRFSDGERVAPLGVPDYAPEWAPAELERYLHVVAMEKHTAHSVGRRDVLEELHAHVDGVGNPNPLLLTGPAGSGKSTTLATLVSEIQSKAVGRVAATPSALEATPSASGSGGPESAPEPFVLLHTFGLMGRSDDIRRVLLRLCAELKQRFNIYVDLPDTLREVAGALPRFLAHAALFGKVVFILDGLDRAEMHGLELHDYLPAALPLAVRVIVSSAGCKALNDAKDQLSNLAKVVQLPPLGHQERVGVLNSALATVAGGQIHVNEMLAGLVAKEDAGSPLYLLAAVNEIKARVRDNGDVYAAADDANGFPDTLPDLFASVFERLERRYGTTLVAEATTLMAASRAGLREDEVLWLLQQTTSLQNMPPSEWESLRTELEPYCWPIERLPGDPVLCFFQGQLAAAAMRRYANTAAERRGQHLRLCSMFSDPSLEPTHRGVWEVLWNMVKGEAWHGLRCHLTDPRVHALMWNEDTQVDLANLWEALVKGEISAANARSTKRVPGPDGAMVPPPRVPPRRRRDLVAEYDRLAETAPPSPDGVLTPDVYRELMADFLAWSNQPGEASFVLRMLSEAKGDAADLAAVSVNFKLGRCLGRQGLHLEAEETLRRALAAEQLLVGAETPMVAEIVTEICKVKLDEGDLEMAGQLAAHAVSVWEAAEAAGYEEADVNTIVVALVRLADICDELNRTTAAEAAYERSLERLEYMLGPDHPEVAEHLGMMANSYKNHAEWEKAEFCYCRALAFAHRFTGPQSLHISHFYNALAELHRAQGDLPHAQALYQRALQVIETVLGTAHPEVATYLNNLAELLRVQGKLLEAEPMYKRALAIDERAQGTSHPIIAIRLNNLAELFRDRGLLEEAEPLYQRALAIDMAALGANHPNIATYLNNLAGLYKSRELWDKAAEHYTRAIAIDERALGPNHPDVAIYLNNLAGLYKAQGRLDEAEPLYLRALRINEEALGAEHTDMAIYFNNIALLYKAQGKLQDARLYYEQAIDIGERTLGAEHPQVATRMTNLGALLVDMKELDAAQALFQKALEVRRNTVGENHPDTLNCAEWLESIGEIQAEMAEEAAVQAARSAAAAVTTASAAPIEPPRLVGEVPRASPHASAPAVPAPIPSSPAAKSPFPAPELPPRQTTDPSPVRPTSASAAVSPSVITVEQAPTPPARPVPSPPAEMSPVKPFPFPPMATGPVPESSAAMENDLQTATDAVEAAQASVDAMLIQYARSPENFSSPSVPWMANASPTKGSLPAIFQGRDDADETPAVMGPSFLTSDAPLARGGQSPGASGLTPEQQREREEDLEQVPGLAEAALDAFLSAHVEYLGNRQYRCVLDGKVLSKFSIMRVHVAKKFGGLVHQWAVDRSPLAPGAARRLQEVHSPGVSPAVVHPALNSQTLDASPSSPVFGVQRPSPTPTSPERHITDARLVPSEMPSLSADPTPPVPPPPPGSGAKRGANTPRTSAALKRVEELEEELRELRAAVSGSTSGPSPPAATPATAPPPSGPTPAWGATPRTESFPVARPVEAPPAPGTNASSAVPVAAVATPVTHAPWSHPPPPPPYYPTHYGHQSGGYPPGPAVAWGSVSPKDRRAGAGADDDVGRPGPAARAAAAEAQWIAEGGPARSPYPRGSSFSDMLARERGPDPFRHYRPSDLYDGGVNDVASEPIADGAPGEAGGDVGGVAAGPLGYLGGSEGAGRLARYTSPTRRAESQLAGLMGAGRVDRLGLFISARSQQVGRRKFLCEIDGKTFSTMNLMRVHFERHYAKDADVWWERQVNMDPGFGGVGVA